MIEFWFFIEKLLSLYEWLIIIVAAISWLVAFNVINMSNRAVYQIYVGLNALVDPALSWIRRFLPNMGGIDISPIILILFIEFIRTVVIPILIRQTA